MAYPAVQLIVLAGVMYAAALVLAAGLAKAGFPIVEGPERYFCIDGLRGLMALAVMAYHFSIWIGIATLGLDWERTPVNFINNLGQGGVSLFFMTTGFVFYPRILQGLRQVDWRKTFITRAFRILPLLCFSVFLVALVCLYEARPRPTVPVLQTLAALGQWAASLGEPPLFGFAQAANVNAGVLWSLKYEWIFYLAILPLMALARDILGGRARSFWLPVGLIAVSLVLHRFAWANLLARYLPLFALGMAAFEISKAPRLAARLSGPWAAVVSGALLLAAMILREAPWSAPQVLAYAGLFTCVACGNSFGGLLSSRPARVLGECSFSIYLLHGIVLYLVFGVAAPAIGFPLRGYALWLLPLAGLVVTGLSAATYLAIEKPGMSLGRALARQSKPAPSPAEALVAEVAP